MLVLTIILGLCYGALAAPTGEKSAKVGLYMPGVQPKKPDTYLCHGMKMNNTETYITGFVPKADMNIAHHMLLYGCTEPGTSEQVWNCGEMAAQNSDFKMAPTCASGSKILYAWAMDAPELTLPKDVAFEVGGNTDVKYLVLQVHYKNVDAFLPPKNGKDESGLTMITQKTKLPGRAGVYLLGTGGSIAPRSTVYMETACLFDENFDIHPFAYRTHAHSLGKVVSGYRIRNGTWSEIGRMSPQKPQMFYDASTPNLDVHRGDILAARCTMVNDKDHTVAIGGTHLDEMCNFYVMFYTNGTRPLTSRACYSEGPPSWYWRDFRGADMNLLHMPKNVSVVPGTNYPLLQTGQPMHNLIRLWGNLYQSMADEGYMTQEMSDYYWSLTSSLYHPRSTQKDEMCNFYIMYSVKGDRIMKENYCFSAGPPQWSWKDEAESMALENMPEDVSTVPDSSEPLKETVDDVNENGEFLETVMEEMKPRDLEDFIQELEEEQEKERALRDYYNYNGY